MDRWYSNADGIMNGRVNTGAEFWQAATRVRLAASVPKNVVRIYTLLVVFEYRLDPIIFTWYEYIGKQQSGIKYKMSTIANCNHEIVY